MLIGGIPFLVLGAFLMVSAPEILLRRLLGILVLIYVLNSIFKFTSKIKLSGFWIAAVSTLYGFFSGIIGTGGVIKAAVLHHIGLKKQKFVGTFAASALIFLIIKAIIFSKFSLISLTDVPLLIPLLIIGAIGPFIGRYLLRKFSSEFFRKLVIGALFLLSINLLFF